MSGNETRPIGPQVQIFQPVVPQYRLPVFDELYRCLGGRLIVSASRSVYGCPDSVSVQRPYLDLDHGCTSVRCSHLHWQHGMKVASPLGVGDVIVLAGNPRFLSTFPIAVSARRRGAGLVVWTQAWSPTSRAWTARIRWRLIGNADAILLYTETERKDFCRQSTAGAEVFAAGNAIDLVPIDAARQAMATGNAGPPRYGIETDDWPLLLYVGRLRSHPPSELDVALSALAVLRERHGMRVRLAVIGDGEERPRLIALANELRVSEHVLWLGAIYDEMALAPWFSRSSAFVYPGAIGLGLMHAMAYGLPVITHGDFERHNPEIEALRPGETGLVFERGNAYELASQVAALLSNAALRSRLGASARVTVEKSYTVAAMVARMYQAICAASIRSIKRSSAAGAS